MSGLLKINGNDFLKGLVVAVLAAVFTWAAQVFNAPGFNWAGVQWDEVLRIAVVAGSAYIGKNWLSTSDGKFMGAV